MEEIKSNHFYPIFAPSKNETTQIVLDRWDAFHALPKEIQEKLSNDITAERVKKISQQFSLNSFQVIIISRTIREYYFGEIEANDIFKIFMDELGLDSNKVKEITNSVLRNVLENNDIQIELSKNIDNLLFQAALKQYPELGEQLITGSHIKLTLFPERIRPSIKNWISDYTLTLGYDSHSSVERGSYIFQSPNARTLGNQERQKLAYILRSFDENSTVSVNTATKQIIFPSQQENRVANTSGQPIQPRKIINEFERNVPKPNPNFNLGRPMPKNVVNLREE